MTVVKEHMSYDTKVLAYQTMDSITNAESKDKPLLNSLLYTTLANPTFTKNPLHRPERKMRQNSIKK